MNKKNCKISQIKLMNKMNMKMHKVETSNETFFESCETLGSNKEDHENQMTLLQCLETQRAIHQQSEIELWSVLKIWDCGGV